MKKITRFPLVLHRSHRFPVFRGKNHLVRLLSQENQAKNKMHEMRSGNFFQNYWSITPILSGYPHNSFEGKHIFIQSHHRIYLFRQADQEGLKPFKMYRIQTKKLEPGGPGKPASPSFPKFGTVIYHYYFLVSPTIGNSSIQDIIT